MAWLILIISGVLEAVWATALGASKGFKRLVPSIIFVVALVASMAGLSFAMGEIPTGTAYAIWTGIGAALTVIWAFVSQKEKPTFGKIALLVILIGCVAGLKLVS